MKNAIKLLSNVRDIDMHENIRLATFNVKNMYTNIPTDKIKDSIDSILDHSHIDDTKTRDFEVLQYHFRPKFLPIQGQAIQTGHLPSHGCTHLLHLLRNIPAVYETHYLHGHPE